MGKLPGGSSKINRLSLNRCPPYTEIFSKRRKIYAVCVESLSMPVHWIKLWVVESCIQIKFVNALFASTKDRLGTKWIRGNKSSILWNVKSRFSSGRQTLRCCWPTPSVLTLEQLSVDRPGGRAVKRFLPARSSTVETDTRGQAGMVKLGAYWQQKIELQHFLGQTSTWKLEKDVQMLGTLRKIGICKIRSYFGFLAWPNTSIFSIASRPFG